MTTLILVVHVMIAIVLIGVVLLQRSEGGALGIGGGGSNLLSGRGAASLLTRVTAVLAASFMATSIILAILAGSGGPRSVLETTPEAPAAPLAAPNIPGAADGAPSADSGGAPAVPVGD